MTTTTPNLPPSYVKHQRKCVQIIKAYLKGYSIEYRRVFNKKWKDASKDLAQPHWFDFKTNVYRIKNNTIKV